MVIKALEFFSESSAFLVVVGLVTLVIGWLWYYNWKILNNPDDASRATRLKWLREAKFGEIYLAGLRGGLERVARWMGDGGRLTADAPQPTGLAAWPARLFDLRLNPWTEPSFQFVLRLAIAYPLLFVLLFWGGGGGAIAGDAGSRR